MDKELLAKIDKLIEEDRAELARDVIKLVNIKSTRGEPKPGMPWGEGPRKVLDTVLQMGKERGFYGKDYGVGVISLALNDSEPDVGVFAHGDVVPEGDGWIYEPYNATEYKGCIIGRGATDNKGQLVSILHLLSIFKKLGIKLKYNPALYVGSNEETGMEDMIGIPGNPDARGFVNVCKCPRVSLVPDGGFPVGYGGKGKVTIDIIANEPLSGFTIEGGHDEAPGKAEALFDRTDIGEVPTCTVEKGEKTKVWTQTPPRHSAHPDPNGNMITVLTKAIIDNGLCSEKDAKKLDFIRKVSCDTEGNIFDISRKGGVTGDTVVATISIKTVDGKPCFTLGIRYPIELTYDEMVANIEKVAAENGFSVYHINRGVDPYLLDVNWEVIQKLNAVSNEVTGSDSKPYTVGGGTYAHRLPNALVYGMNGCLPPEGFPEGHGSAHGRDEVVSLDRLQRAMRIFARAFLTLDETDNW